VISSTELLVRRPLLVGRAQQLRKPVVGFLHSQSYDQWRDMVVAFKAGLESETNF
jgi:hypothetical protein